jgi:hypothetical protein
MYPSQTVGQDFLPTLRGGHLEILLNGGALGTGTFVRLM